MALSGLIMIGYLLAHMYGNLKVFSGETAFNDYAHHLRVLGEPILPRSGLLWILRVILLASGSEVEIALATAEQLEGQGVGADVVSMPCTERFDAQDDAYREDILPDVSNREILRVSIEAGTTFGWERYTGLHGLRVGIDRFGASAPAPDLYEYFGLTADAVARRVTKLLQKRDML